MKKNSPIFVAGHRGLAGGAIYRTLEQSGYSNLILRSRAELDLRDQAATARFFAAEQPEYVFLAAAKVGGILANSTQPAEFLRDNLAIQTNVIHSAWQTGVKKLLFLGSSCIYPRLAPQPMREDALLTGPLEATNEWYAVAKIAGIKMCQAYRKQYGFSAICLQPTNLYGPGDNFDLASSHVLPALLRKFHEAKLNQAPEVVVWGSGSPLREFLHVDDLASAAVQLMDTYDGESIVNVGSGEEVTIRQLAELIREITGYPGVLTFDATKPDGTPRKLLDLTFLHSLGWKASIPLAEGIRQTYKWYLAAGSPAR